MSDLCVQYSVLENLCKAREASLILRYIEQRNFTLICIFWLDGKVFMVLKLSGRSQLPCKLIDGFRNQERWRQIEIFPWSATNWVWHSWSDCIQGQESTSTLHLLPVSFEGSFSFVIKAWRGFGVSAHIQFSCSLPVLGKEGFETSRNSSLGWNSEFLFSSDQWE